MLNTKLLAASLSGLLAASWPGWSAERVALLTNGNVLRGEIRQLADEVVITTPTSEIRLPINDVELVKPDLRTAYRAKAGKLARGSGTARAQLIRWCLRHGLRREAELEFARLQREHPRFSGLETLQKQLSASPQIVGTTVLPVRSSLHPDVQFAQQQVAALSKASVSQFVRTIQPLLTNRCAQAGCHGNSAAANFSLLSSHDGRVPQHITYRNLGATLRRIGDHPAEQTLLWMSARAPHGGMKRQVLSPPELEKLWTWIRRVNAEQGRPADRLAAFAPDVKRAVPSGLEDPFDPAKFNELTPASP